LLSKKKSKLALDYFDDALKIDSTSHEAKYGIAMYYQEFKDYTKALELYRKMILDYPQDKDAYYNTGYIYFQLDSIDKAVRSFDRAIDVAPDYADAYYMRGLCAEMKKDFKNAKYFYQQSLNLNPNSKLAQDGLQRISPS
jgi:tetratricopeptide (TPR) repeat protein